MYGDKKSVRLYLKVRQARSSHEGKPCDSRVSVSFPASRASLTFKRCRSSQHSETRQANAPLITVLSGSFVMDTSSQPNLPLFRCEKLLHVGAPVLVFACQLSTGQLSTHFITIGLLTSFFLARIPSANQILKMPSGKYTVREREMLMGVVGVPSEFFQRKGFAVSASVFGESLTSAYSVSMLKQSVWNMFLKAVVQMLVCNTMGNLYINHSSLCC